MVELLYTSPERIIIKTKDKILTITDNSLDMKYEGIFGRPVEGGTEFTIKKNIRKHFDFQDMIVINDALRQIYPIRREEI